MEPGFKDISRGLNTAHQPYCKALAPRDVFLDLSLLWELSLAPNTNDPQQLIEFSLNPLRFIQ